MELVWIIYLIEVTDSLKGFETLGIFGLFALGLVIFMVSMWQAMDNKSEQIPDTIKKIKPVRWFVLCLCLITSAKLVPSKDTGYKMIAAYGVTEVVQNEDVQRLAGKSLSVIEKAMDKYIQEGEKQAN